jgi:alpha-galactosidase
LSNEKITLIGAGSLQFGLGTVGGILDSEILKGATIFLHDINEQALKLTHEACESAINERNLDFNLESTVIRKEALKNATFIINSIEVTPRFKLFDMDYRVPQEFGNKQITGENGGPGGLFHSLRTIPPILDICEDIQKICPNALFINYSNPLSRICLAIKRKYPFLKFVGLCHEFQHFMPILTKILGNPTNNYKIKAGGLNHFGIILDIKHKDTGKDAYPIIRKNGPSVLRSIEEGPFLDSGYDLIAFILETYGYLPYTTDGHYGEYMQWAWEMADIPATRKFIRDYDQFLHDQGERLKRLIKRGKGAKIVKSDGECATSIIEGILTDSNYEEPSVNIPNEGIITNLPQDLVVECPAIINKSGIHGIKLGEYPKGLAALLRTQASVQDLVVEAILTKSKDIALQALLADPVVETYWQAKNIFDEMLKLQEKYLQIELV